MHTLEHSEHKKFFWVIEGDISSYFDTINHRKLMKILRAGVLRMRSCFDSSGSFFEQG